MPNLTTRITLPTAPADDDWVHIVDISDINDDPDGSDKKLTYADFMSGFVPLTTKGDLLAYTGTQSVRVPVGIDGQVLVADSTQTEGVRWGSDIAQIEDGTAQGQIAFWDNTAGEWTYTETTEIFWDDTNKRLGIGNASPATALDIVNGITTDTLSISTSFTLDSQTIVSISTGASDNDTIVTKGYVDDNASSPLTTKGDIFTYNTGNARLPVGSDGEYLVSDSGEATGLKWQTPADKEIFFTGSDYANNLGDFRTRSVGATGSQRFTFIVPYDFIALTSLVLVGIVSSGAAGSARDIDLTSDYGAIGEAYNNNSESDTTSTYDLTGYDNEFYELDISSVFSSIAAGDYCGLFVDHKGIGGAIDYIGIKLKYSI